MSTNDDIIAKIHASVIDKDAIAKWTLISFARIYCYQGMVSRKNIDIGAW